MRLRAAGAALLCATGLAACVSAPRADRPAAAHPAPAPASPGAAAGFTGYPRDSLAGRWKLVDSVTHQPLAGTLTATDTRLKAAGYCGVVRARYAVSPRGLVSFRYRWINIVGTSGLTSEDPPPSACVPPGGGVSVTDTVMGSEWRLISDGAIHAVVIAGRRFDLVPVQ